MQGKRYFTIVLDHTVMEGFRNIFEKGDFISDPAAASRLEECGHFTLDRTVKERSIGGNIFSRILLEITDQFIRENQIHIHRKFCMITLSCFPFFDFLFSVCKKSYFIISLMGGYLTSGNTIHHPSCYTFRYKSFSVNMQRTCYMIAEKFPLFRDFTVNIKGT